MAKPKPYGVVGIDSALSLSDNLLSAHFFLEGAGTSTGDSKGSKTGTLSSSSVWTTDTDGPLIAATGAETMTYPALFDLFDSTHSGSIAWRAKLTNNDAHGMLAQAGNASQLYMNGGNYFRVQGRNGFQAQFSSVTSFTTQHDYVLTYTQTEGNGTFRLYIDGSISADGPVSWGNPTEGFSLDSLLLNSGGASYIGTLSYFVTWQGHILSASEAAQLAANPYSLLHFKSALNNYQAVRVGNGMSTGERIR